MDLKRCACSGALVPDVLISELNLPRMSGFELLSVVRTRFPQVAVVAISGDYTPHNLPNETTADAFLPAGPNLVFELMEAVRGLVSESPIRGSRPKSSTAAVWIPCSASGYIILTCPECLRSFSIEQPTAEPDTPLRETCLSCGASVPFSISAGAAVRERARADNKTVSRDRIKRSEQTVSDSKKVLAAASRAMTEKKKGH